MKIAIIGANGNLGSRITRQALDRGHQVRGFIYDGESPDDRAEIIKKSLFEITEEELHGSEVMISAYGSGFQADPGLNRQAFIKYIELNQDTQRRLITIGGAGSLYTDDTHQMLSFEAPEHPGFLKEISRNIKMGIDELKKSEQVIWTVVCPSAFFDADGPLTKDCQIGTEGHLIFNEEGKSYLTYEDMAYTMLEIAEKKLYMGQMITVGTRKQS